MRTDSLHIVGIAGSLRKASANKGLLRAAGEHLPDGVSLEIIDIAEVPLFNEDVRMAGLPESVRRMNDGIRNADGVLFATVEYNYSISGVLKNAIDWASRPLEESPLPGKPMAMMGTGGHFGTARAQYHLRQVAVFTEMLPMNKPELFVPKSWEKFDQEGNLIDESIRPKLVEFLAGFAAWIRQVKAGQLTA
jgi:chromate reductase